MSEIMMTAVHLHHFAGLRLRNFWYLNFVAQSLIICS